MNPATIPSHAIADNLARTGFAFVRASDMYAALTCVGSLADWAQFSDSWNDLAVDTYMADQGRYRRRRHAAFAIDGAGRIVRQPAQAHYQALDYNPLHGGIARWFAPIVDEMADGASLHTILRYCSELFGALAPAAVASWQVEVHQFRIEARTDEAGKPTPEGVHRDGVDYVLVLLIARTNILSGTTTIHAPDRSLLGSFTLTDAFDAALVVDARVYHGVTPVQPLDPDADAFRDVLVVTFRVHG
jgi:hypothetical protein